MVRVEYRATDRLPAGVPTMVIDGGGDLVVILISDNLTMAQAGAALTPMISDYVELRRIKFPQFRTA